MHKIGWNEEHAKNTPKQEWIKKHLHWGSEKFLSEEYDKLVPPKKEKQAETQIEADKKDS